MNASRVCSVIAICCLGAWQACYPAGLPGDAEAATHGDEAATLQVVTETQMDKPDFVFRQYNLAVLSHYSYLAGSRGEAMIVDPARDISRYLKDAEKLGLKITRVYLTHSHADFVAGHMELAKATGAPILINKAAQALYPHQAVEDKASFQFGDMRAEVITTPGHTPDGTCLLVYHPAADKKPTIAFTGDTLFIGSVGRPDLMGGTISAAELAVLAFRSWTDKLSVLPDDTRIFPAHGAGSLCGAHLSDKPVSTIGEQKKENPYVQHKDVSSFVTAMIDGLPEAPQYFKHNAKMNHDGPPLVDWNVETPPALTPAEASDRAVKGAWLIDARNAAEFAAGHAANAINIGLRGRFETWTGMMIPWGEPFVLIGSDDFVREAAFRLHRIGYDSPAGYLKGGVEAWKVAGQPVQTVKLVKPADLSRQMQNGTAPIVVDVRLPSEWMAARISENLLNIPLNHLAEGSQRLDPSLPVLTVCNSAYRSSLGASVLQKAGFKDVRNMEGGSEAWIADGLPIVGSAPSCALPATPPPAVSLHLAERMVPEELAQRLGDLPGTVDVVDIRPAWQFAEFSIPGSVNVSPELVLNGKEFLSGGRPLVVVCRDGSISAALAGALTQKTVRPIRFLSGGVARYYDEIIRPKGVRSDAQILPSAPAPAAKPEAREPATPAAPGPAPVPAPAAPKKKSAGC